MILSPQQVKALERLQCEMGEVIMVTAPYAWDDVKDRKCGLTLDMVLDWLKTVESILKAGDN